MASYAPFEEREKQRRAILNAPAAKSVHTTAPDTLRASLITALWAWIALASSGTLFCLWRLFAEISLVHGLSQAFSQLPKFGP